MSAVFRTAFELDTFICAIRSKLTKFFHGKFAENMSKKRHGFLPSIVLFDRLPQRIDPESFLLALHIAAEAASPYFRLGYNSLCAFATINHLHFQVLFIIESENTSHWPLQ